MSDYESDDVIFEDEDENLQKQQPQQQQQSQEEQLAPHIKIFE